MIENNFYFLLCFGLTFMVVALLGARWASDSWLNPLVVNVPYIGLGGCFVGLIFISGGALAILASFGLMGYLAMLFAIWRTKYREALARPNITKQPDIKQFHSLSWLVAGGCTLLVFMFIPQIAKSGFSLAEISSFRYVVRTEAKFTFLIFMAVKGSILYTLVMARTRSSALWSTACYLFTLVPILLLGSKGVLLSLLFDGLTTYYLRSLFQPLNGGVFSAKREKGWMSKYVWYGLIFAIIALASGPVAIWLTGSAPDYMSAVTVAYSRTLASFDSVFFAVDSGLKPGEAGLSLPQWWFATPLKALGLYSNPYNAVNQLIMMTYFGIGADAEGMFPNNFQVMEAVLGLPIYASVPFLMVSGATYAYFITWLCRNRYKSPVYALGFIMAVSNPYLMLIDGQSFWGSFIIVSGFVGVLAFLAPFVYKPNTQEGVRGRAPGGRPRGVGNGPAGGPEGGPALSRPSRPAGEA